MNKIVDFDSKKEFNVYIQQKRGPFLGIGSEGRCYLGKDNLAYKVLNNDDDTFLVYDPKKIITTADVSSEYFAFPDVLFTIKGEFAGYTAKAIVPNLFSDKYLIDMNTVSHIDFDRLIEAYHVMREEIARLTSQGIRIYDLPFNLTYDGHKLVGIDTCVYQWDENITLEENTASLDEAMKKAFYLFLENNQRAYNHDQHIVDDKQGVEDFLKDVESTYKTKPVTFKKKK